MREPRLRPDAGHGRRRDRDVPPGADAAIAEAVDGPGLDADLIRQSIDGATGE